MEIRLIVIRTTDPKQLAEFYSVLGCSFVYHQHGNGPFHYSTTIGSSALEIYPLAKNQEAADKNLRLGFAIDQFEETIELLKAKGVSCSEKISSEYGELFVVTDPDGRKVELYKK